MAKPNSKSKTNISTDLASFLKVQSTKKNPSSKTKVPVNSDHAKFADTVYLAIQEAHDAQAIADAKKQEAIAKARDLYQHRALEGDFSKSINFDGDQTAGVQVTFKDDFRVEMDGAPAEKDSVIAEVGKDNFNKYFEEKRKIVAKKTDDKSVSILREKLGDALFAQLFEVTLSVGAKDDTDRKQFEAPEEVKALLRQVSTMVKAR